MKILLTIFFLGFNYVSTAQIITTFAGYGCVRPDSGDGIPATAACIGLPASGSFDAAGNFYFAEDFGAARIEKVSTDGIITTVAGNGTSGFSGDGGPATDASIVWAFEVVDSTGNIYIPDRDNYRVRKVNATTGIITTIAGNGTLGHCGDGNAATTAALWPNALCIDKQGNVYVIDSSVWVRKISPLGIITTVAGNGIQGNTGDGGSATAAEVNLTYAISTDLAGNLYLGGYGNIRKVDITTGIINTIAGNGTSAPYISDGPATTSQFLAIEMTIDRYNNVYIADYGVGNNRILKLDTFGYITSIAGNGTSGFSGDGGPGTAAELCNPEGVAVDVCGNVYIADDCYRRIRKVTFNPSCTPADSVSLNTTIVNINKQVSVYPNPAHDEVNVTASNKITGITITNLLGQQVRAIQYNSVAVRVDMRGLPTGVYFMKITDEDGGQTVERIIKSEP